MGKSSKPKRDWYLIYSGEEIGALPFEVEFRISPTKKGQRWDVFKHVYEIGEGGYQPEKNSDLVATVEASDIRRYVKDEIGIELPDSRWTEMGLPDQFLEPDQEELTKQQHEERLIEEAVEVVRRGDSRRVTAEVMGVIMNRLGLSAGATHRNFDDRVAILAWPVSWELKWDPGYSLHYLPMEIADEKRRKDLENGAEPTEEEIDAWKPGALRSWSHTRNAWVADILKFEAQSGAALFLVEEWTGVPSSFLHERKVVGLFPTEAAARSSVFKAHPEAVEIPDWPRPSTKS